MPVGSGRRRAVLVAALTSTMLLALAGQAATAASDPPGLSRFMAAVGKIESGGRYTALNTTSGAYGKYQIIPSSWRAWADRYLGNALAPRTPANQEKVARDKMTALYRWLGSWRRVAYWWLTGSSQRTSWSDSALRYVNRVMRVYYYPSGGTPGASATVTHYSDNSSTIAYDGRWATARHHGYAGGGVHYAKSAGASLTFTFTGTRVSWYGPVGPTRGQARVSIDGVVVKTVNLYRSGFRARVLVYSATWSVAGSHELRIEVVGTKGHPLVAIDELLVRR